MPLRKIVALRPSRVRMVNVSEKRITSRLARAKAVVRLSERTLQRIERGSIPKGDVLTVARVAGIQAAKETSRILPLCHPIPLASVEVILRLRRQPASVEIEATAEADWKTGVEMEALTAVTAAALTVYDMCKSIERGITIGPVELLEKRGGRSGTWNRNA